MSTLTRIARTGYAALALVMLLTMALSAIVGAPILALVLALAATYYTALALGMGGGR